MESLLTRVKLPTGFRCAHFNWDMMDDVATVDILMAGVNMGKVIFNHDGCYFEKEGQRVQFAISQYNLQRKYMFSNKKSVYSLIHYFFD